jgi:hypothetical protein
MGDTGDTQRQHGDVFRCSLFFPLFIMTLSVTKTLRAQCRCRSLKYKNRALVQWNEKNNSTRRNTSPSANLSIKKTVWIGPKTNPGLRSDRLVTRRSHFCIFYRYGWEVANKLQPWSFAPGSLPRGSLPEMSTSKANCSKAEAMKFWSNDANAMTYEQGTHYCWTFYTHSP